jgi:hypothetical protein
MCRFTTTSGKGLSVASNEVVLNPEDPFDVILIKMVKVHRAKRTDYAGEEGHPNQNFYDTAYQLGLTGGHAVETLIGTKQARLRILLPRFWKNLGKPQNEGIEDTLLDRAVYSVIALTIWEEGGYGADAATDE